METAAKFDDLIAMATRGDVEPLLHYFEKLLPPRHFNALAEFIRSYAPKRRGRPLGSKQKIDRTSQKKAIRRAALVVERLKNEWLKNQSNPRRKNVPHDETTSFIREAIRQAEEAFPEARGKLTDTDVSIELKTRHRVFLRKRSDNFREI